MNNQQRAKSAEDVSLDAPTMAAAAGMFAHLQALGSVNTTVRGWVTGGADSADKADSKTDNSKKSTPKIPRSPDVLKLIRKINSESGGAANYTDIAVEFTNGNPHKAKSLLRQVRRFPHLLEVPDSGQTADS